MFRSNDFSQELYLQYLNNARRVKLILKDLGSWLKSGRSEPDRTGMAYN